MYIYIYIICIHLCHVYVYVSFAFSFFVASIIPKVSFNLLTVDECYANWDHNKMNISSQAQGRSQAPKVGGAKLKKKSFGGAKIRKNNKIWGKILIFLIFLGENLGAWGAWGPPKPQGGSAPGQAFIALRFRAFTFFFSR
jgi:hypothetical protein